MTSKRSNKKFFLGIAVSVLVPLSFYFIARALKKDHINLPGYYMAEKVGTTKEDGVVSYDTVYHQTSNLSLTNQFGDVVSLNDDLKGKVLVVNFFFTNCPVVCPKLTSNMKMLENAFRKDPKKERQMRNDVQLISITVNPSRDSFPALRAYADRFNVNHDYWWFLTGDKKKICDFARHELGVSAQPDEGGADDFIHSEKIIVIDQDRFIRGYYDGLDSASIGRCAYDISLLTMEKKRRKK